MLFNAANPKFSHEKVPIKLHVKLHSYNKSQMPTYQIENF